MALVIYSSELLGRIAYDDAQYEINRDGYLWYTNKTYKPTQPVGLKNYSYMFRGRNKDSWFDSINLSDWDMSEAENLEGMFSNTGQLIIDGLEKWNVSKVKNMSFLFSDNYNLINLKALRDWDVSNVEDISFIFQDCWYLISLEGLEKWNVSSIKNVRQAFANCYVLEDISALCNWNFKYNVEINIEDTFYDIDHTSIKLGVPDWYKRDLKTYCNSPKKIFDVSYLENLFDYGRFVKDKIASYENGWIEHYVEFKDEDGNSYWTHFKTDSQENIDSIIWGDIMEDDSKLECWAGSL